MFLNLSGEHIKNTGKLGNLLKEKSWNPPVKCSKKEQINRIKVGWFLWINSVEI